MQRNHPWQLTFDEFVGPTLISDKFEIHGRHDIDYEALWETVRDRQSIRPPIRLSPDGFSICEIDDFEPSGSFVLLAPDGRPCGFYMDAQCWVDPEHRGRGLSTLLISAAADWHGGSPTNNRCGLGFSPAGIAAHRAAHRSLVLEAFTAGENVPEAVLREYDLSNMPKL